MSKLTEEQFEAYLKQIRELVEGPAARSRTSGMPPTASPSTTTPRPGSIGSTPTPMP